MNPIFGMSSPSYLVALWTLYGNENEAGLEIPAVVTCLDAIVQPIKLVKQEFEAVAWSQRACFDS